MRACMLCDHRCTDVWSRASGDGTAQHGMCASATLSLSEAKSMEHAHTFGIYRHNKCACLYPFCIHARSYMEDRTTDACAHRRRAHVLRWGECVRACALGCGFGCPHIRAEPCELFPSAWTACGSPRRRSTARRSTRTSARGTPHRCRTCTRYVPPAGPAARHRRRPGRARPAFDAARPVVRGSAADERTCRHSVARGHGCRYGCAEGRFDVCARLCTHI
jgi:hypothetical protein